MLHYVGANGVEGFRQRTPKNAVKIAEILLNAGADFDAMAHMYGPNGRLRDNATAQQMKDGFTWACEFGRTEVVDFLLQRGMDVAAKLRHHGQTGLHWAACGGHPDIVRLLLKRQAPVNAKDDSFDVQPNRTHLPGTPSPNSGFLWRHVEREVPAEPGRT